MRGRWFLKVEHFGPASLFDQAMLLLIIWAGAAMIDKDFSTEFAKQAALGTPPVGASAASMFGWIPTDLQSWCFILTILYLLMQMYWLGCNIIEKRRANRAKD